ncbi:MAG: response regulator [Gemmatimonadaceae bacterium]|nr:response regulator [Gemmatimonadaceae bacterium]
MHSMFLLGLVSLTLQYAMAFALALLGRAPRWRPAAWFAVVALTAGFYSTVDAAGALWSVTSAQMGWTFRANLVNGTLHAGAWLLFTHLQPGAHWRDISRPVRWAAVLGGVIALAVAVSPFAVTPLPGEMLYVPGLGDPIPRAEFAPLASAVTLIPLAFFAVSGWRFFQRWRAGEPGTGFILIGFALFMVAVVEEVLVASGIVNFIYLADFGYICVVTPVTVHLLRGFVQDARALDDLRGHLANEVERRTAERDEARQLVVEQQRLAALGRLAAGVGHEVNSPLQYLRLSLDELELLPSVRRDANAMEHLGHAFEGVDRVRHIVDALRTYSRPTGSDSAPLDLRDVVHAALRVGASQWRTDVAMEVDLEPVPLVRGHEGRLVQAVLNALVNAVYAVTSQPAGQPRRVHVRTTTTLAGWAEIMVSDSGPGFSAEIQERLGEPFVTTKADAGGTGLGMFVLRGIVQTHGGHLTCRNAPLGGAQVAIALPPADTVLPDDLHDAVDVGSPVPVLPLRREPRAVHTPPSAPITPEKTASSRAASVAPSGIRMVMVEDDAASLRAYVRGLGAEGFVVQGFTDASAALKWLEDNSADIVVTDLMMPGMSGSEFASQLAARFPTLRDSLIVLTGGAVSTEAEQFLRSDTVLVLEKPISRMALATQVRQRLGQQTEASAGPEQVG